MSTATILPFQRHTALAMSVLVLNRSFVAVHVTNVRRALALLFAMLQKLCILIRAIFQLTLLNHGENSLLSKHSIAPPIRTGFAVLGMTSRPPASFGCLAATNCHEKTCDLIVRMCLPETQTGASTVPVTSRQANFRSIT